MNDEPTEEELRKMTRKEIEEVDKKTAEEEKEAPKKGTHIMKHAEIEIIGKAKEASLSKELTDEKLIRIANEVEPNDGAQKHADLLFSLAEKYELPTDKYLIVLEDYRQDYRQTRIDKIEDKIEEIARFGKITEIGENLNYDKLLIALKEREELKKHNKAEMVSAKESLFKDLKKIEAEAKRAVIKTGFDKLDERLGGGLRNGRLYGLGGITSLGKTTLALNIAENIATEIKDEKGNITKTGRDVLIFSLEMARSELLAKNISKRTFEAAIKENPNDIKKCEENAVSLIDLYNSNYSTKNGKIAEIKEKYWEETAPRLNIMEGVGNITVDTVRLAVETFIEKNRPKLQPVVIIDFLQILSPLNERSTDKQIVDRNISELKRLTRDLDVAVVAISSFNRQNYAEEVSFESFKESGSVEYSVDVLMGLQLWVKERKLLSNNEENKKKKREAIDEAKKKNPREIELVILKNRIYKTGQSVFFKYFPAFDYFTNDNCGELYEEKKKIGNNEDGDSSEEEEETNAEKKKAYGLKLDKNDPRIQRVPK